MIDPGELPEACWLVLYLERGDRSGGRLPAIGVRRQGTLYLFGIMRGMGDVFTMVIPPALECVGGIRLADLEGASETDDGR